MEMGIVLHNRYKVLEKIGSGGFAETFLALDENKKKKCVLKYLSLKKADKWKSIELFEREAKILRNIDHPFIPDFIDFFTLETEEDTQLYLVQEFIQGKNLAQLIAEGKHFTEKEVLGIAEKMAKILQYLHRLSPPIIHRDIKPSNIIFVPPDNVYLIDFGAVRDTLLNLEQGGSTIIGTFGYMPMEQYEGRAVPATDIYSLGVTLIHLLSHKDPAIMKRKHMRIDFRPHLSISKGFAAVLDTMIEPDYKDRFHSAQQLYKALNNYRKGKSVKEETSLAKEVSETEKKRKNFIIGVVITVLFLSAWVLPVVIDKIGEAEKEKKILQQRIENNYDKALEYIEDSEYQKAINLLEDVGDYKDAEEQKAKARALLDEEERVAKEKAATEEEKKKRYDTAMEYKRKEKYTRALSLFKSLGDYKDAKRQVEIIEEKIRYEKYWDAVDLLKDDEYEKALALFLTIKGYKDSDEKIEKARMYIESEKRFIKTLSSWGGQELAVSPDGKFIAYAKKYLNFLSLETGKKLKTISPHNGHYIKRIELNSDGSILATAGGKDKSFKFWNTTTFEEIKTINIETNAMVAAFHPDGKTIACGHGDGTITLWTYPDWKQVHSLKGQDTYISALRFNHDGTLLASGNNDKTIHLWDVREGALLTVFQGHTGWVTDMLFLPGGEHLVSGSSDDSIRIWSLATGLEAKKIKCGFWINAMDLDKTGKVVVCCGNRTYFEFWSLETGKRIQRVDNHSRDVYMVKYLPGKKEVISCGYDVNLWDAEFD